MTATSALALAASAAAHTPGHYYIHPDLADALAPLDDETAHEVAAMLAIGALRDLHNDATITSTFVNLVRKGVAIGSWTATLQRTDIMTPADDAIPAMDGERACVAFINHTIAQAPGSIIVPLDDAVGRLTKSINGQPLSTAAQGLMHACARMPATPVGGSASFVFFAAAVGGTPIAQLRVTCTRTA